MAVSKNIHTYTDVHRVLTAAKENGGAQYKLKTAGAANNWIQRANTYVKLLHDQGGIYWPAELQWRASKDVPGLILIGSLDLVGELKTLSGDKITPPETTVADAIAEGRAEELVSTEGELLPHDELTEGVLDLAAKIKEGLVFDD